MLSEVKIIILSRCVWSPLISVDKTHRRFVSRWIIDNYVLVLCLVSRKKGRQDTLWSQIMRTAAFVLRRSWGNCYICDDEIIYQL